MTIELDEEVTREVTMILRYLSFLRENKELETYVTFDESDTLMCRITVDSFAHTVVIRSSFTEVITSMRCLRVRFFLRTSRGLFLAHPQNQ